MERKFKKSISFIISLFLLATIFFATNAFAQGISYESNKQAPWDWTNYWYDASGGKWLWGQSLGMLNQPTGLYQFFSEFWPQYSNISLTGSSTQWSSFRGLPQALFPDYSPLSKTNLQILFKEQPLSLQLPLGCQMMYEQMYCSTFRLCHIPLYCPIFIPGSKP